MDKQTIINNRNSISLEELLKNISEGKISKKELIFGESSDGELFKKRDLLCKELEKIDKEDHQAWNNVDKTSSSSIQEYIDSFNNGIHIQEANTLIQPLKIQENKARKEADEILDNLKQNPSSYNTEEIIKYIKEGKIAKEDLINISIPNKIINPLVDKVELIKKFEVEIPQLGNENKQIDEQVKNLKRDLENNVEESKVKDIEEQIKKLEERKKANEKNIDEKQTQFKFERPELSTLIIKDNLGDLEKIPDHYTEVYFWGRKGTGKTCALAAIFSTANKMGCLKRIAGSGWDYMNELVNFFNKNENSTLLPEPTSADKIQYLPFELRRKGDIKKRSVSLFELSGEIIEYFDNEMGKKDAKLYEKEFQTVIRHLKGSNRKIHFFFIDFDAKNKVRKKITQENILSAASGYFEHKGILETTDGIFVVITKSDLMPTNEDKEKCIRHWLQEYGFASFMNNLKNICEEKGINKLGVEFFSLGKVYFQEMCDFDSSSAENILNILFQMIEPDRDNGIGYYLNK